MLHGAILRSPHAHAVIIRVDASRAALIPGVVAVLTGDDIRDGPLAPTYGPVLPDRPLVAFDRVRFAGEPVAAVAAVDRDAAAAALGAIEVEYDPLPSAVTAEEAAEADAPVIHDRIPEREFVTFPDLIAPLPGEPVIKKAKPSAFFGSPLASYLPPLGVDTIVVAGTTTSGCVRATVVDAFSLNYRVIVAVDAVFDRGELAHAANLFDMHAKYADVVAVSEIVDYIERLGAA
jgi:nicotinamidase-related amidase